MRLVIGCLVLSGVAGLMYEIAWIRRASLLLGATTPALSTVLAVFFAGLALGAAYFGQLSRRQAKPLRLVAYLEAGIGLWGFATLFGFPLAEKLWGFWSQSLGEVALAPLIPGLLTTLLILPATFLMGGTLPLFARALISSEKHLGRDSGLLYAANTLGAVLGCLLAGLWGLRWLGSDGVVMLAALWNGCVAAVAWSRQDVWQAAQDSRKEFKKPESVPARTMVLVGIFFFTIGFVALAQEVIWSRFLVLLVRSSITSYTISIAVVLLGLVLGALLASALADRTRHRGFWLGLLQASLAIVTFYVFLRPSSFWQSRSESVSFYFFLLLPGAVLSGATLPFAVRLVTQRARSVGRQLGRLLAMNTTGGIAGALATGFWLLPSFGMQVSMMFLSLLALVSGIVAWWTLSSNRVVKVLATLLALVAWWAVVAGSRVQIPADYLPNGARLLAYAEGREANLAVLQRDDRKVLEIDRWWQGQDVKTQQIMAAHIPMKLHADARDILVVGAGAGMTPSRFLLYDIRSLDCVDIEPEVFNLIEAHFESSWMQDPRVRLLTADGRQQISYGRKQYDVVSLEVGQLFRPGSATFYTRDFYQQVQKRLKPGGLLSQFVPISFTRLPEFQSIVATFLEVFPHSTLWYNNAELLLIGGVDDRVPFDRLSHGGAQVVEDLEFAHWGGPAEHLKHPDVLLASFLMAGESLQRISEGADILRDRKPVLEYASTEVRSEEMLEIEIAGVLQGYLDDFDDHFSHVPAASRQRADSLRQSNLGDIVAAAQLRKLELAKLAGRMKEVPVALQTALQANPLNVLALRWMGDLLLLEKRPAQAEEYFHRVLAIDPEQSDAQRGLGFIHHARGELPQAQTAYEEAVRLNPEDAEAFHLLGTLLAQQGKYKEGIVHVRRALEIRPSYPQAQQNLARMQQALSAN